MAPEYSYNDLMQMQEQAIRRVHEMQQRARLTAQESGDVIQDVEPEKQIIIKQEPEKPANAEPVNVSQPSAAVKRGQSRGSSPLAGLSSLLDKFPYDDDMAVILPIILLLLHEGSDEKLLLALLYIMS